MVYMVQPQVLFHGLTVCWVGQTPNSHYKRLLERSGKHHTKYLLRDISYKHKEILLDVSAKKP